MRHKSSHLRLSLYVLIVLSFVPVLVLGQDTNVPKPTTQDPNQAYKIGIGDLLIVRVFGHTDLGGEFPVGNQGTIRLPFSQELQAACKTELELSSDISEKLKKYLRQPQVDVVVKEYRSQPVSVIGAIVHPSRFQLQRRVRLLELIANAGGPAPNAGSNVFVIHNPDQGVCDSVDKPSDESGSAATSEVADTGKPIFSTYKLKELMQGAPDANKFVSPGDIVSIPEADKIYVTGQVIRPGALPLQGGLTLLSAIAQAGGFESEADKKNVKLIRPGPDGKRQEQEVNAEDIEKHKADDPLLLPNDLIQVPSSTLKNIRKSLMQIVPATVAALPLVILP
jgi:polysaccharide export outer membrane protein